VSIEVAQLGKMGNGVPSELWFGVANAQNNWFGMGAYYDRFYFIVEDGGNRLVDEEVAFQYAAQRWWRLREDDGQVFIESAPDGITWTVRAQAVAPDWVDDLTVYLGGGTWDFVDAPGVTAFDNLNIRP
jgi:hypothetical protein